MKQKKIRTDILCMIIFVVWTIISAFLFFGVAQNEDADTEKIIKILKILFGVLYMPVVFFPFIFAYLNRRSKATGDGKPLSIEAMHESKKHIPEKIYKFCSLTPKTKDNNLNEGKLKTLSSNQIWISRCSDLNDPFEGINFILPEGDFTQIGLPEEIKNRYHVNNTDELIKVLSSFRNKYCQASFSTVYNDIQMWGYYANGCRGYCVEYKVIDKEYLFPVFYINKRIILSGLFKKNKYKKICIKNLKQMSRSTYKISAKDFIQYNLYLQSFKYAKWEFEKEIRAIDITSLDYNGGNQFANDLGLQPTKIIVGYLSEYIEELKHIAKQLNVQFSIMKPNFETNKFQLIEQKVF